MGYNAGFPALALRVCLWSRVQLIDQEMKERLTGAAVLVALGVIFIPLFLDGPAQTQHETAPRPLPVPERAPPAEAVPRQPEAGKAGDQPQREKPAARQPAAVAVPPDPLTAWAVQVGSFSSQENAERLSDELSGKGYRAFVTRLNDKDRILYRVRVGPEQDRERAELLARRLKKDGQPTAIVRHP